MVREALLEDVLHRGLVAGLVIDVGELGIDVSVAALIFVLVHALVEEGLGTVVILGDPGGEARIVDRVGVHGGAGLGGSGFDGLLEELAGLGEIAEGVGVVGLLDIFLADGLERIRDVGGLGVLRIDLVGLGVGLDGVVQDVGDGRVGDLDHLEDTVTEVVVAVGIDLLMEGLSFEDDILDGRRLGVAHDELEILFGGTHPGVSLGSVVGFHAGLAVLEPGCDLGGLLGIRGCGLGGLEGRLGGRDRLDLCARHLQGGDQGQC